MSQSIGTHIQLNLFGESHGPYVGATLTGLPAGVYIDEELINKNLTLRRPDGKITTTRIEQDEYRFISGVKGNYSNGNPLTILIPNADIKETKTNLARPSHADYATYVKNYPVYDIEGGGFSSGRLSAPLVALGSICESVLTKKGINIFTEVEDIKEDLAEVKAQKDSIGATISVKISNVEAGLGGPYFSSLESKLAQAVMAIPGIKGIEFGLGFGFVNKRGSKVNDNFVIKEGKVTTLTNNCGGINGGITNGNEIIFRVVFKPTPSIGKEQDYLDLEKKEIVRTSLEGRSDPCIALRGQYVVKAICALIILNELLEKYGKEYCVK